MKVGPTVLDRNTRSLGSRLSFAYAELEPNQALAGLVGIEAQQRSRVLITKSH